MASQLLDLRRYGQSVWYDFISRYLFACGELLRMITRDGLAGVTSNPTILEQAINTTDAYDEEVAILARRGMSVAETYLRLVVEDIAEAADNLHSVYEATGGSDGYVSVEVSPELAHDAAGTVTEALRLWQRIGRDNVMVKVPGTQAGFTAVNLSIPGEQFSFGTLELAQALGDFASLEATGRRSIHVHLRAPEIGLLQRICTAIEDALR